MNYKYFQHFSDFWIPIYKKQVKYAFDNDDFFLLNCIYNNIDKNWHLREYKNYIFRLLGIYNLKQKIEIDYLKNYFNKRKEN